ncbi:La-related protein 6C [Zea mays]|uniref:La-related protein 6C n=1 Tax=Zea mays TaxID=4577 RepID=A0A1D6HQN5_MAIZE|nr:La-related protein 6C [Zea mays]ONM50885.1 La-related protein 6C [Zea mays]
MDHAESLPPHELPCQWGPCSGVRLPCPCLPPSHKSIQVGVARSPRLVVFLHLHLARALLGRNIPSGATPAFHFKILSFILIPGRESIEFRYFVPSEIANKMIQAQILVELQARSLPTDKLRPAYIAVNAIIYVVQLCIWIYLGINDNAAVELASKIFIVAVSFVALLGFSVYGGRLFVLLRRFPIESKGRQKKLYEVGTVTAICVTCFLIRCVVVALSAFDADVSLEVLDHPVLDFFYYMFAEILPSALVLFVLRKLPPKRVSAQYHPIN